MASLSVAELGILNWIQTNCHNEFWDEVMPVLTSLATAAHLDRVGSGHLAASAGQTGHRLTGVDCFAPEPGTL